MTRRLSRSRELAVVRLQLAQVLAVARTAVPAEVLAAALLVDPADLELSRPEPSPDAVEVPGGIQYPLPNVTPAVTLCH